MKQQDLHYKIIELGKNNKKVLSSLSQHIQRVKKEIRIDREREINDYKKQYEQLMKLNEESQEENLRLKKELAIIDVQIQQLSIKNTLSRSRIKMHSQEIEIIKDQTYDLEKKKRREKRREQDAVQIQKQAENIQSQIQTLEKALENRSKGMNLLHQKYQQLIQSKQNLIEKRKETHKRNKLKMEELQEQLREVKNEANALRVLRQKQQQKTKRNNKVQTINQIRGLLRRHKQTYQ